MQNSKCKMQNKGVAFGDYLNHFPKENTTILHSAFSILHSRVSALNWALKSFCIFLFNVLYWKKPREMEDAL